MGIFEDRPDEKIAQTGARIEVGELSFRPSIHAAAFGADPEGIVCADAENVAIASTIANNCFT